MATWDKTIISLEDGTKVEAHSPIIVSASRSTDIPAFYCDWFFHRLTQGYSAWSNPFNGKNSYISYDRTKFIVFWSKNPRPLLKYLPILKEKGIGCYIQYSLNDYVEDKLENKVPSLEYRIETFKLLVNVLGKGSVVWRFDPLMLTTDITIDKLITKIENIGDQLLGHTEKLVFSFADISEYKKVKSNLERNNVPYVEWNKDLMVEFTSQMVALNRRKWNYRLATCGERIHLDGVEHNHCVDDELIIRRAYKDKALMDFLGVEIIDSTKEIITEDLFAEPILTEIPQDAIPLENGLFAVKHKDNSDKGQRIACGCIKSKDIGEYNTCIHQCEYCYANTSKQLAELNYMQHLSNPYAESITGKIIL